MMGRSQRTDWIKNDCTEVPAAEYGGTEQPDNPGKPPFGGVNKLSKSGA
ncbi:hypothetical protein [Nonomuraea sp. CA-141351]